MRTSWRFRDVWFLLGLFLALMAIVSVAIVWREGMGLDDSFSVGPVRTSGMMGGGYIEDLAEFPIEGPFHIAGPVVFTGEAAFEGDVWFEGAVHYGWGGGEPGVDHQEYCRAYFRGDVYFHGPVWFQDKVLFGPDSRVEYKILEKGGWGNADLRDRH